VIADQQQFLWQDEPGEDTFARFVFVWVDVIGHSQLLAAKEEQGESADLQWKLDVHAALLAIEDFVRKCTPGLCDGSRKDLLWDWAGDGGLLAFPLPSKVGSEGIVGEHETLDEVLAVAERIVNGVVDSPDRNSDLPRLHLPEGSKHLAPLLKLRVVVHHGQALYASEPRHRRSTALNIAAKVRFPSDRTSLTITDDFYRALTRYSEPQLRRRFVALDGLSDPVKSRPLYGQIDSLTHGLQADIDEAARVVKARASPRAAYDLAFLHCAGGNLAMAITELKRELFRLDAAEDDEPFWYWRTWRSFLKTWIEILSARLRGEGQPPAPDSSHETPGPAARRAEYLRDKDLVLKACAALHTPPELLDDMELILAQSRLLADRFVDAPSGLSTLHICRFLLRAGHSPLDANICRRLDRIENEMEGNDSRTIDGDCSLCTATAVSCLALAGRLRAARPAINWLASLEAYRYCYHGRDYTDAKKHEHALHYAAAVLEAFSDLAVDEISAQHVRSAFRLFPDHVNLAEAETINDWMRYRNISELEVYATIFPAILRSLLHGRVLLNAGGAPAAQLAHAIDLLARRLKREKDATAQGRNLYSLRENLASFALAKCLGNRKVDEDRRYVLSILQLRSAAAREDNARVDYNRTMDSNVERTRALIEGWLCHWETELWLEHKAQRGGDHNHS